MDEYTQDQVMGDDYIELAQLDDIPDQVLLEDGSTHELQILKAKIGESGEDRKTAGQKYLLVTYKATDVEDCAPFTDVFMLPFNGLEKEQFNMRGRQLRTFFDCFQFDYHGFNLFRDTDQLKGLTGEATVKVVDDDVYGEQNAVKKYL